MWQRGRNSHRTRNRLLRRVRSLLANTIIRLKDCLCLCRPRSHQTGDPEPELRRVGESCRALLYLFSLHLGAIGYSIKEG